MTKPTNNARIHHVDADQLANVRGGSNSLDEFRSQFITLGGVQPTHPTPPSTGGLDSSFGKAANK